MSYSDTTKDIINGAKAITASEWRDIQKLADQAADSLPQHWVRKRARARITVIECELISHAKTGNFNHPSDINGLGYIHLTTVDWQEGYLGTHEIIGEAVLVRNATVNENCFVTGDAEVRNSHMYGFMSHARVDDANIYFIIPDDTDEPEEEFTPDYPRAAFVSCSDCGISFDDFEDTPTVVASRTVAAKAHASVMADYDWNDTSGLYVDEPQSGDDAPDWYYGY